AGRAATGADKNHARAERAASSALALVRDPVRKMQAAPPGGALTYNRFPGHTAGLSMEQAVEQADLSERSRDEGLRFARRMYVLRVLGLVLGAVCIGGALWSQGAHAPAWAALLANALVWPHIAYPLARRSGNPYRAELSSIDGLSRLPNRSHWESVVASEFQRCRRIGHPSSVMMIDIDHFKEINDRHGHPVGDEVIRNVAELVRRSLRLHDVPGRYGGEEFGVVLPGTGVEGAQVLAERIRARIESAVLEPRNAVRATLSIGVA